MVHGRELGLVRVDQGQLEQVIINLAVNARDAMAGGGRLTISTSDVKVDQPRRAAGDEMPPGAYVAIEVQDTGHGIPPDILDRIFDPFFSTKGDRVGHRAGAVHRLRHRPPDRRVRRRGLAPGPRRPVHHLPAAPSGGRRDARGVGGVGRQLDPRPDRCGLHPAGRGRGSGPSVQRAGPAQQGLRGAGGEKRRRGPVPDGRGGAAHRPPGHRRGDAQHGRAYPDPKGAGGLAGDEGDLHLRLCRGQVSASGWTIPATSISCPSRSA